jgi:uncharacterized protein YbjT (DUF2867 family)
MTKTILVTGATGQQGGAVARNLLQRGFNVRGLTRNAASERASALAAQGIELAVGDMTDRAALDRALEGVDGVFSVQNTWTSGPEGEIAEGVNVAEAVADAGIGHLVYSSVGGAERGTGLAHFESKWNIEKKIESLGIPATILRPVFFMENLLNMFRHTDPEQSTIRMAMHPDRPLQMIAVEDIGHFATMAFERPEEFIGRATELAGDARTMPEAAEIYSRILGRTITFEELPVDVLRSHNKEMGDMFAWFNESGYRADIPHLRAMLPELLTLEQWLRKQVPAGVA